MRKRRVYLVVLILAVAGVVGLIVAGAFREREPEYGGKRLSEWVDSYSQPGETEEPANESVRQIGTNAIPYLLGWMRYERAPWKDKLYQAVNPMIEQVCSQWQLNDGRERKRAWGASLALAALGLKAEAAIPDLTVMANDGEEIEAAARAANILNSLGSPGLPALIQLLTNRPPGSALWNNAAFVLGQGTNYPAKIKALDLLLESSNSLVREAATNTLFWIGGPTIESEYFHVRVRE